MVLHERDDMRHEKAGPAQQQSTQRARRQVEAVAHGGEEAFAPRARIPEQQQRVYVTTAIYSGSVMPIAIALPPSRRGAPRTFPPCVVQSVCAAAVLVALATSMVEADPGSRRVAHEL
jgi:hypothetical protein